MAPHRQQHQQQYQQSLRSRGLGLGAGARRDYDGDSGGGHLYDDDDWIPLNVRTYRQGFLRLRGWTWFSAMAFLSALLMAAYEVPQGGDGQGSEEEEGQGGDWGGL